MTAPVYPVQHVTTGIGLETTYGTSVAPSFYIATGPVTAADNMTPVPDQGWRGPAGDSFGHVPGTTEGAISFGGDVFADTIGYPLAGILGDVTATGTGPTTTTMAVLNTGVEPPSYTVTTTDPVNSRRWAGCKFSSLVLSSTADGSLQYTTAATSLISVINSAPTPSYTAVKIYPGWQLVAQIGGSSVTSVLSSTLTLSRAVTPKRNTDGTQAPYLMHSGICSVSGQLTLILQTDTYRALYVAGTSTSVQLNYAQGSGSTATQVQAHCSDVILTSVVPDYTTGNYQQVKIDWAADYNTTDVGASGGWSPVKMTLKNQVVSGKYK